MSFSPSRDAIRGTTRELAVCCTFWKTGRPQRLDSLTLRDLQQGLEGGGTGAPEKATDVSVTQPAAVRAEGS